MKCEKCKKNQATHNEGGVQMVCDDCCQFKMRIKAAIEESKQDEKDAPESSIWREMEGREIIEKIKEVLRKKQKKLDDISNVVQQYAEGKITADEAVMNIWRIGEFLSEGPY